MIYVDSSVVLSRLFVETRSPDDAFWSERLGSSRLLQYEVMNRVNVRAPLSDLVRDAARLLDRIELIELTPAILARALAPFPVAPRTLDGLHLATLDYLRSRGLPYRLASYDKRLSAGATALGLSLFML